MNDGSMMSAIDSECFLSHSLISLVGHLDDRGCNRPFFISVLVIVVVAFLDYCFKIYIDGISGTRCVHPATSLVEALVDEELSPSCRTVGIQPFATGHLQLRPKEERRMWVDQQQRVMTNRVRGRD